FVKLARTIRTYRASIEATIEWKLTNGVAESVNAAIGRLRANARGFHARPCRGCPRARGGVRPDSYVRRAVGRCDRWSSTCCSPAASANTRVVESSLSHPQEQRTAWPLCPPSSRKWVPP
ncbi:MAG: transposase, partial [Actinobacteria bacterium]|nr:transposase [Actinomycetota bacterium]